jgi:hypothetical protein
LNRKPDWKVSFTTIYDAGVVLFGRRVMTWCKLYMLKSLGNWHLLIERGEEDPHVLYHVSHKLFLHHPQLTNEGHAEWHLC